MVKEHEKIRIHGEVLRIQIFGSTGVLADDCLGREAAFEAVDRGQVPMPRAIGVNDASPGSTFWVEIPDA